jgi:beta-xylosidase
MIEAVMLWNEPNNKSHWDFEIDPEWAAFSEMIIAAAKAIRAENPRLPRVLGGISPIDPAFIRRMQNQGVLDHVDALAVHGFPLDWNHWQIGEWPAKIDEIRALTHLPVWVSEVGVSSFGAEEVQAWGLTRTAELLLGGNERKAETTVNGAPRPRWAPPERVHWYSLFDLPKAWPATTRHREAEGSSYYRHFYMGLIREDGTPKPGLEAFRASTPRMGLCQWFHFEDHRLDAGVRWMRELGVTYLRTGLSWADSYRPGWERWFDRQMAALEPFGVTATFCFTPEHRGVNAHHTSPPQSIDEYADFCARMVRRYAPGATAGPTEAPARKAAPATV